MATRYEVRTFEDIVDAILEELGETRSNTKMLSRIKRDVNAIYIHEVVPYENWTWLKKRFEVQTEPYFSTGTATCTSNSVTVTLTESPAKSYKGYYFATDGHSEHYRIAQHTANSSTVTLESPYTGSTDDELTFKIWTDNVPLPPDVTQTVEVSHAYQSNPLEARGPQEFERVVAQAPRASYRPRIYSTGEKVQPDRYESISSLPASATRSSSGRIRTVKFASSLGVDQDSALLRPGDKIEVSSSSSYNYNVESVVVELSTTTNTNDTIKYIAEENLTESSTADTAIVVKLAPQDAKLFEYRPLFYYPSICDSRTTLRVQALLEPVPLEEDEDEPLIPLSDRIVLVYGALSRGWVKARDQETALDNERKFERKLAKMAGRIEDSLDKPRITISSEYRRAKYKKGRGYSVPLTEDFVGGSGSASEVSGTANRAAVFNSEGKLAADSNISTTELGYLDNVSSNIQTQLDAKLGSQGTSTDNALVRWNGTTGNALQDSALSISDAGVASLTGSLAVDNLKLDGNSITSTDANGNINLTPNGTGLVVAANAKVSNLSTGVVHADADGDLTSSAIVNADVDAAAAIAYSKLNLATSIVNADVAAAAAIARSKLGTGTADHVVINAGDGTFSSEAALAISRGGTGQATATAAFDALAPTTTAGDLIVHNGTDNIRFPVSSTDGQVIVADSTQTAKIKWAPAPSGNINWIPAVDRDGESSTFNWNEYVDAASTSPADGTGEASAPDIAITRTTVANEIIRGSGSFKIAKPASNQQGEGVSCAFTIDQGYYENPKVQTIKLRYQTSADFDYGSGTAADPSDIVVYVYDVTNATLIQPDVYQLDGSGEYVGQFQPSSTSGSYRLILHIAGTNASAWDFFFDDVEVGPSPVAHGVPGTDWQSYTPTGSWVANTTYTGKYRRVGDSLELDVYLLLGGAPTAAALTVNLPSGVTIDTTKLSSGGAALSTLLGSGVIRDEGTASYSAVAVYSSTTAVSIRYLDDAAAGVQHANDVTATTPITFASSDKIHFRVSVPVLGWGSSSQMSHDASTRIIALRASGNPASAASGNPIIFPTVDYDDIGGYSTSTGEYTAKVKGTYRIHGRLVSANASVNVYAYVDGVQSIGLGRTDAGGEITYTGSVRVNAGQVITIRPDGTLDADVNSTLHIERISGPAVITASEVVSFAANSSATAISSSATTVVYSAEDHDTHGAYDTSTGVFTAPVPGYYVFSAGIFTTATYAASDAVGIEFYKNNATIMYRRIHRATGNSTITATLTSPPIKLLAGETIRVRVDSAGTSPAISASSTANFFGGHKVGGV
jgi:hypothetical protein